MSALRPAFFILYLESYISRLNEILRHDLTLSVGEPDNAAAQTGAGTAFGGNGDHEQGLGQARPNKITSEMQTHCRSEVPDGQNIFKN